MLAVLLYDILYNLSFHHPFVSAVKNVQPNLQSHYRHSQHLILAPKIQIVTFNIYNPAFSQRFKEQL